jgi:hypothetical protein
MNENNKTPNLFWPVVLIGAGAILLLTNLNLIEFELLDLLSIVRLWPLLLVALGLNLMFGRNNSRAGSAVSMLLGLSVIAVVIFGPSFLEPYPGLNVITESYVDPLTDADSARVHLDFDKGGLEVAPLYDSENLIQAEVTHNGNLDFDTSGKSNRNIDLKLDSESSFWDIDILNSQRIGVVGLNADLPIELIVDIGSGNSQLDLEGLHLTEFEVDSGSGKMELVMPSGLVHTNLDVASGSIDIQTVEGSELDLAAEIGSGQMYLTVEDEVIGNVTLDSGSGRITMFVPRGLAVRVIGSTGSGNVDVPDDFDHVSGSEDSGTWESPDFDLADEYLVIEFRLGSGVVRVQYQ